MDLIEMKCSPGEMKGPSSMCCEPHGPQYPYGLRLDLGEEEIAKLGLDELPDLDDTVVVMAVAMVKSRNEMKSDDGKVYRNLCLQITAMNLKEGKPEKEKVPLKNKMYGDD